MLLVLLGGLGVTVSGFSVSGVLSGEHPIKSIKIISIPSSNKEDFFMFVCSPVPIFYNHDIRLYAVFVPLLVISG